MIDRGSLNQKTSAQNVCPQMRDTQNQLYTNKFCDQKALPRYFTLYSLLNSIYFQGLAAADFMFLGFALAGLMGKLDQMTDWWAGEQEEVGMNKIGSHIKTTHFR